MSKTAIYTWISTILLIAGTYAIYHYSQPEEGQRQFTVAPGHSYSPLPCGTCHLQEYPELKPKLERVTNQDYKGECGTCHLAYQPELLPKASWKKVMETLDSHFGDEIELSKKKHYRISRFLYKNAGDKSKAVRALAIISSLEGATPMRITEAPYIIKTHKEIVDQGALKRAGVGSLANCENCHISADGALYYKKHIVIPDA